MTRRALDLLVGGTLLAQVTLAATQAHRAATDPMPRDRRSPCP
jgi:hypothetical protein